MDAWTRWEYDLARRWIARYAEARHGRSPRPPEDTERMVPAVRDAFATIQRIEREAVMDEWWREGG